MKLSFPNPSRSFDPTRRCVRFWAYDNALEVNFVVKEDMLEMLQPDMSGTEAGFLAAFDATRQRIHEAAERAYVRSRARSYAFCLTAADL